MATTLENLPETRMGQGKEKVKGDAGMVALMGFTKSRQVQAFASGQADKKRRLS